jgi:hypothetical protein
MMAGGYCIWAMDGTISIDRVLGTSIGQSRMRYVRAVHGDPRRIREKQGV